MRMVGMDEASGRALLKMLNNKLLTTRGDCTCEISTVAGDTITCGVGTGYIGKIYFNIRISPELAQKLMKAGANVSAVNNYINLYQLRFSNGYRLYGYVMRGKAIQIAYVIEETYRKFKALSLTKREAAMLPLKMIRVCSYNKGRGCYVLHV